MPIQNPDNTVLSDLTGYKAQRRQIMDNTVALLDGKSGAKRLGVEMPQDELIMKAEAFAIRRSGRFPRVAKHFVELLSSGVIN